MKQLSRIESLPVELIHEIYKYLDGENSLAGPDGKYSLRLSSPILARVGLEHVMREISFVEVPRSMSRLEAISKDETINHLVQTLVYEMDVPNALDTIDQWHVIARHPDYPSEWPTPNQVYHERLPRPTVSRFKRTIPESIANEAWKLYETYKSHYRAAWEDRRQTKHREAFRVLEFEKRLAEIMARFPKLKHIHCLKDSTDTRYENPSAKHHFGPLLLEPANDDLTHPVFGAWQLEAILVAMAQSQAAITFLSHSCLSWAFFGRGLVFANEALQAPLKGLEDLMLFIRLDDGVESRGYPRRFEDIRIAPYLANGAIQKFLSLMPNLKDLRLRFRHKKLMVLEGVQVEYLGIPLPHVMGSMEWPRLKVLYLSWVKFPSEYFLQLLQRHAATLKDLFLKDVHVIDTTWASMFDQIPRAVKLDNLHLEGKFESSDPPEALQLGNVRTMKDQRIEWYLGGDIESVYLEGDYDYTRLLTGRFPCRHLDDEGNALHGEDTVGECEDEQDDEISQCVDYWYRSRALTRPPVRYMSNGQLRFRFAFGM